MKNKIIFLMVIIIIVPLLIYGLLLQYTLVDKKEIMINFTVGNHVGLDVDNDALKFGTIIPGDYGMRNMTINSDYDFDAKVKIKIRSDFEDWYSVSENNFILKKDEKKDVVFFVNVPNDAKEGRYISYLDIYIWKTI